MVYIRRPYHYLVKLDYDSRSLQKETVTLSPMFTIFIINKVPKQITQDESPQMGLKRAKVNEKTESSYPKGDSN